jgi:hypothetical protein
LEAAWLRCDRLTAIAKVGVGEYVGIVETAFAEQAVRIDCKPTTAAEIQHVLVVEVAVEDTLLSWRG